MTGDDHYGYGSDKLKDDKQRYPQADVASDADFNSNHGSDNEEESLPAYESPDNEEPQAGAFIIAWTSISRAPSSSTDDSDDCVVRMSSFVYFLRLVLKTLPQVCGIKPKHPGYPTCGLTCARKLEASGGSYPTSTRSSSGPGANYSNSPAGSSSPMCVVSASSLFFTDSGFSFYIWEGLWRSSQLQQRRQKVSDVRPDL
jgi:hypothetical protein